MLSQPYQDAVNSNICCVGVVWCFQLFIWCVRPMAWFFALQGRTESHSKSHWPKFWHYAAFCLYSFAEFWQNWNHLKFKCISTSWDRHRSFSQYSSWLGLFPDTYGKTNLQKKKLDPSKDTCITRDRNSALTKDIEIFKLRIVLILP